MPNLQYNVGSQNAGIWRQQESLLCCPSAFNAALDGRIWDMKHTAQSANATRNTVDRKNAGPPRISHLFMSCSPLAISWFIIAVVVYTFQFVGRAGSLAHVSQEVFKLRPLTAYLDAPAAVIMKGSILGISASLKHAYPRGVGCCLSHAVGSCTFSNQLFLTTTRLRVSSLKMMYVNCGLVSAQAKTFGHWLFPEADFNYFKSSKSNANQAGIFVRHNVASFNVVFSSGRPATTGAHCDYELTGRLVNC